MPGLSRRLRSLVADLRPLRESPPFRRLWIGSSVSNLGGSMTAFALILQTYQLTRSSLAVGAVGLAQGIPAVAVGLFGGALADAVDRRRLVLVTSSSLAVVSAVFAAQAFAGLRQLWLLYALAVIQSALQSVDAPARRTFLPHLVPPDRVAAGVGLNQLSGYVSFLLGPALAGVITAAAGLKACYLIDAVSFSAALYGVARLPAMPRRDRQGRPSLRAVAEGLSYIRRHRVLLGVLLTDMDAVLFALPVALFPALNAERFGGSPETLGLLSTALATGGLLGSALSGPAGRVTRKAHAMLFTTTCWGAAIAGFGFARTLWLALALLVVAGALDTTSVIFRGSVVQAATPDRLRGRVTAVDYVVGAGVPKLGNFESGAVASFTSPGFSAVSGGLVTVAGALLIRLALPAMARYQTGSGPDPENASDTSLDPGQPATGPDPAVSPAP
ncbi:MAG TPA: MFS transporter [Streptosporangiaceae bacterium]|nr:MFS transporter [Streptosporangiaceae bacterium]